MRSLKQPSQAYPLPLASHTEKLYRQGLLLDFEKRYGRTGSLSPEQSKKRVGSTVNILLISCKAQGQVKWPSSMTERADAGLSRVLGTSDIEVERDTCRRHKSPNRLSLISSRF